jgi:small-conductance mechanosensitive channel
MEEFRVTRQTIRRTTLCLALLTSLAGPASGQAQGLFGSDPPSTPAQDTAAPAVQAVPVSEVPLRADETVARLQVMETQLSVDPDLVLIEERVPGELAEISRAHERLSHVVLEQLSLRELWSLTSIWKSHEGRLAGWVQVFDEELQEVAEVAEAGSAIRAAWRLTAEVLRDAEEAPDPLVEQATRVLDQADVLEAVIRDRLSYLVDVKSRLDEGLGGVRAVLAQVDRSRASVRGRVLSRGAPPLWNVGSIRESSGSPRASRLWTEEWEAVAAFAGANSGTILLSALLLLIFALLAVWVRHRIESDLDLADESLRGAAETLHGPVSAAFLVTALIVNVLWTQAPYIVWQVAALVAIVPIYRLLPRSRHAVVNRTVRTLLAVFAFGALVDILVSSSLEYRLLSVFGAAVLAGACVWLLRDARREEVRVSGWGRIVWRGLQVTLVASLISIAANVFGWTLLAEILLNGVLSAAYLGLATVIAYRVLAGVVRLLPRTSFGRSSHILRAHGEVVTSRVIAALRVSALGLWIYLALDSFEILDPLRHWLLGAFTGSIRIGALEFSLERILSFALVLLAAIWIARFVAFTLDVEVLPRLKLKRGVSNAISTVVKWAILGAGLLTAASALGLEAGQLAIVFGALSVGIGFGLQNIVSNFVSGLILIFEQPVKVGDKVEITSLSLTGEVQRIGIRASVVRTFDGAEVIVPNGNLISSEVVNWTLSDQRRRVRIDVGVAYGTDPHRVMEILAAVAVEHSEVLKYPEPAVVFLGFGESSLDFRLLFWTATFDDFFRVRSEMGVEVHYALKAAGITIPFPQRDLHLRSMPGSDSVDEPGNGGAGGDLV